MNELKAWAIQCDKLLLAYMLLEFVVIRAAVRALVSLAVLLCFTYFIACDYRTFMGK